MKTLGGIVMVRNAIKYDYNIMETLACLSELCDHVIVVDVGSDDGTVDLIANANPMKTTLYCLRKEDWDGQKGRQKLAHFQNVALSLLDTDYYILCQADEIIHEDSFPWIREAIESGDEAFYVTRLNLWKDCNHVLNVPQERKPCSTEIIRLAKTKYKSVDDGESIEAPASLDYLKYIEIWHYGFVRKKEVMKDKIINMQEGVFQIAHDPKLDNMEVFDWSAWFSEEDLKPITKPHPKFMKEWIKTRP